MVISPKKFWSTKDAGQQPFSFNIGMGSVIKGRDDGIMTMQVGEVTRIQLTRKHLRDDDLLKMKRMGAVVPTSNVTSRKG